MTGTRRTGRWAVAAAALALVALLLGAAEARAAKYSVAQCGWHLGNDADWSDTAGTGKFRPDGYCVTPDGGDPFEGAHLKSFTREDGAAVSGTRLARWRWVAPAGTGIVNVRGTWWEALHDGFEHRLGSGGGGGDFSVFASAGETDTPSAFAAGFGDPQRTFESRLLCAKPEDRHCDLDPGSFAAVRAVTLTLSDDSAPRPQIGGGLLAPGWRSGVGDVSIGAADAGSGVRFAETVIDGGRATLTEHPCSKERIGGEWRATRMLPCALSAGATEQVATGALADGPHTISGCAEDFAGNRTCTSTRPLLTDNTPPAAPRALAVSGPAGWRRTNGFDLTWVNPDQGAASPIAAARYRIVGPGGYDSGVLGVGGEGVAALGRLVVPGPGAYGVSVWLRDAAGNEAPANAAQVRLLFDDVSPSVAFRLHRDPAHPELISAAVVDDLSGPALGAISYHRAGGRWVELPTSLRAAEGSGSELLARFPSDRVTPGSYELRADATDAAGNEATTTRRGDGSTMIVHAPLKARTALVARIRLGHRAGGELAVPFGSRPLLSGRLRRGDGAGLAGREVRVAERPARGALADPSVRSTRTGPHGGFRLRLAAGPSRRVRVSYPGTETLSAARSEPMRLRVRGGIVFTASPRALHTGEAVLLRGAVRARGTVLPPRGKLVAIQYFERESRHWRPVMVTRTRRDGRFLARYRFRYITGTARIRLRAVTPPEQAWPYAGGASAAVGVTVRG